MTKEELEQAAENIYDKDGNFKPSEIVDLAKSFAISELERVLQNGLTEELDGGVTPVVNPEVIESAINNLKES